MIVRAIRTPNADYDNYFCEDCIAELKRWMPSIEIGPVVERTCQTGCPPVKEDDDGVALRK